MPYWIRFQAHIVLNPPSPPPPIPGGGKRGYILLRVYFHNSIQGYSDTGLSTHGLSRTPKYCQELERTSNMHEIVLCERYQHKLDHTHFTTSHITSFQKMHQFDDISKYRMPYDVIRLLTIIKNMYLDFPIYYRSFDATFDGISCVLSFIGL